MPVFLLIFVCVLKSSAENSSIYVMGVTRSSAILIIVVAIPIIKHSSSVDSVFLAFWSALLFRLAVVKVQQTRVCGMARRRRRKKTLQKKKRVTNLLFVTCTDYYITYYKPEHHSIGNRKLCWTSFKGKKPSEKRSQSEQRILTDDDADDNVMVIILLDALNALSSLCQYVPISYWFLEEEHSTLLSVITHAHTRQFAWWNNILKKDHEAERIVTSMRSQKFGQLVLCPRPILKLQNSFDWWWMRC